MADGTSESIERAGATLSARILDHESAKSAHSVALAKLYQTEEILRAAHSAEVEAHAKLRAEMRERRKMRRLPA
jgi:hypothetical protein